MEPFYDNSFACCKSAFDDGVVFYFGAGFDESFFNDVIGSHNIYIGAAVFYYQGFRRYDDRIFAYVHQQFDACELPRQQDMIGVGHFGPHGEGARLGVDLRVGEVDQTAQRVGRAVGQRYCDVGIPRARGVAVSEVDVAGFRAQVFERGHAEVDAHRVALDHGGQQRLPARPDQRADVGVAFGDVARNRRPHGGVAQRKFRLRQVGFAHHHIGRGALVGGHGVVQVELAGGVLFVEGADAVQIALSFQCLCLGLVQLGFCAVGPGAVELRVDDEQRLPLFNIGAFGKEHPFEVALHAGADFDELLGTDAAYIFAVDVDVLCRDGFHLHHGQHFGNGPRAEHENHGGRDDRRGTERAGDPAAGAARQFPDARGACTAETSQIGCVGLQQ